MNISIQFKIKRLFKNTLLISMVLFTSYVTSQSVTYEGERNQEGEYHGQGVMTFPSGEKYVGEFKDGKLHPQIKTRSERVI